jgi:NADPH:quinone reductase-like Zn-dependent oxidoreductase
MKAALYTRYGQPDVVQITEVEKPVPRDNEVLIKVCAASVNPLDGGLMKGKPYTFRLMSGLSKPKVTQVGVDVAGQVEVVGAKVTEFQQGDLVFGLCTRYPQDTGFKAWICQGAFAEYACAAESTLVMKPENVTFEEAASVPVAALTALQGLRDKGKVQRGQCVLINGAAGGVGTFAVQIAKWLGAQVTGVTSKRNVEMVESIGADHVIDYSREDFTKSGQRYDVIFDCVGNHSLSACRRVLNPRGIYIGVGGPGSQWLIGLLARPMQMLVLSWFVGQKLVLFLAMPKKEDLTIVRELMASGKVRPVIDRCYTLQEVPEALTYLEGRHARGKVVIVLGDENTSTRRRG